MLGAHFERQRSSLSERKCRQRPGAEEIFLSTGCLSLYPLIMRILFRACLLCLLPIVVGAAYGIPPMKVTISEGRSKPVFQGTTRADGTFASAKLPPGHYVVQFSSKSQALQGDQFLLILLTGKKTLISNAVPGEKFTAAGVAAEMEVSNEGKIAGQIASARDLEGSKIRMINGKRYHWMGAELGSNLGGRWVTDDAVIAQQTTSMSPQAIRDMQNRAGEGSLVNARHAQDYSGNLGHGH